MDAKPHRPLRTWRVQDENAISTANGLVKSIHQRHKSSPVLTNLMQAGATKLGVKRAAFGDVSNQRNIQPSKDDFSVPTKGFPSKDKSILGNVGESQMRDNVSVKQPQAQLTAKSINTITSNSLGVIPTIPSQNSKTQMDDAYSNIKSTVLRDILIKSHADAQNLPYHTSTSSQINNNNNAYSANNLPPVIESAILPSSKVIEIQQQASQALQAFLLQEQQKYAIREEQQKYAAIQEEQQKYAAIQEEQQKHAIQEEQQKNAIRELTSTTERNVSDTSTNGYSAGYSNGSLEGDYTTKRSFHVANGETAGGNTLVLAPKYTSRIRAEIAAAKDIVDAAKSAEEIEDERWDTTMVTEYSEEIFEYMRFLEERMRPNPHYMDHQNECQWSMRAVLLDWLVQVHARFSLLPETLFLSVNYIDRFLSCKVVSLAKLQLVGATALFLAAKYEEVNCPTVGEIVYMVDDGFTMEEILKAERFMLSMLAFELGWPGPMSFLRRISKADDYDLETRTLAKYFLEVTIMDERFVGCTPSSTAAAAHCLARLMLRKGDWTAGHVFYSNYTYAQLRPMIAIIIECCEDPIKHHAAVFSKYGDKRYKKASLFVQTEFHRGFELPALSHRNSSYGLADMSINIAPTTSQENSNIHYANENSNPNINYKQQPTAY